MDFVPERLISLRQTLGISKAEAARRANTTAMSYGRYESGERVPSYQTVSYLAQALGSSTGYLYGESDGPAPTSVTVVESEEPELFLLVRAARSDRRMLEQLVAYAKKLRKDLSK